MTILVLFSPQRFVTPFWSFFLFGLDLSTKPTNPEPPTTNKTHKPISNTDHPTTNPDQKHKQKPTKIQHTHKKPNCPSPIQTETDPLQNPPPSATAKRKREEKLQTHYHGAGFEQRILKCRRTSPNLSGGE